MNWNKTIPSVIVILSLVGYTCAQKNYPIKRRPPKKTSASIYSNRTRSSKSYNYQVYVKTLSSGPDGRVWMGGAIYPPKGLLIYTDDDRVNAVIVPKIANINDVLFTSRDMGWLLSYGQIYNTKDGGLRWQKLQVIGGLYLNSIFFSDIQHGWVIGQRGNIYYTSDGGITWSKQNSNTDVNLNKICFVDALHGWVIGKRSYGIYPAQEWETVLIATDDAGQTWKTLATEKSLTLNSISFVDKDHGWSIDSKNNIIRTNDGGQTWAIQRPHDNTVWESIFFINELEGWAVGDGILHTSDGGETWSHQLRYETLDRARIEAVVFIDNNNGWAIRTADVLHTKNGGSTWEVISDKWQRDLIKRVELTN